MNFFFNPEGIAVIGASDNQRKGGFHLFRNTLHSYKGKVYPVNPRVDSILDVPCYPDISSVPGDFDLALFFIPAPGLPSTIEECAKKGVKGIIIESAGFAETGRDGVRLQEECVSLAKSHGIRLWGPNCMGLLDAHLGHVFSFMYTDVWKTLMKPGNVSMTVQSGMLSAGFLMMVLERGGLSISKMCSIGNKCDVNETELLEYFINDPSTDVIGHYAESISAPRRFIELASGTDKPIVLLKGGRSPMGAKAAMSHTASMASDHAILRSAMRQAGIVEVTDMNELMDFLRGFSKTTHCSVHDNAGTAVVTFSGGGGIVTTDLLHESGLSMAELSNETLSVLKSVFPPWMEPANPVDIWPAIEHSGMAKVYTTVSNALMYDEGVDSVIIHIYTNLTTDSTVLLDLARLKDELGKPVVAWLAGMGEPLRSWRRGLESIGIPVFDEMSRSVSVLSAIKRHQRKRGG
ncbi:MAG TPA: CoA-binding protein, partial [Deltaproteobacteria bacterium]|nr:CoA-binding protein [Deltaproteobacteria bacterium]HPR56218.1 CoA-binding protein [Deltaproteobacteria bacterium]HXK46205.1 CoA-binding protein [Deltaproteobacteria bacterium]